MSHNCCHKTVQEFEYIFPKLSGHWLAPVIRVFLYKNVERPWFYTVKPVLSGHSKIDKTKVLKANSSLMKVESIAECSLGAFCNTFDLHLAIITLVNVYVDVVVFTHIAGTS